MDNTIFFNNTSIPLNLSYRVDPNNPDNVEQTVDVPVSTTSKPLPETPPSAKEESSSSSGSERTVTYDNTSNKIASIYMSKIKKGWVVYSDNYGSLSVSTIDCSVANAQWTAPSAISGVTITSTIHLVYTEYGFPAIFGCNNNMFTICYITPPSTQRVIISSMLPSSASSIQGIYAANTEDHCTFSQVALITDSGHLYNSFVELYQTNIGQTVWESWGVNWSGSPAIGFSNSTAWLFAKYTGRSRPYISYTWARLNNQNNYGMWHNMNYLNGANFVGNPTIARNVNANGTILLAVFMRCDKNMLAYSTADNADGYPSSNFVEYQIPFTPEQDFQFPDVGLNTSPMVTISKGMILSSIFMNKERNISTFQEVDTNADSMYTCNIVINPIVPASQQVSDRDLSRLQIYTFSKTTSKQNVSYSSGEFLLPFVISN